MRIIIKISFYVILVTCFSCEKNGFIVRCADCSADEPVKTDLVVKLDIGIYGAPVAVKVYEGNLEDSVLYRTTYGSGTEFTVPVTLNKKYTLTAKYYKTGSYYTAVDATTPKVRYTNTQCNDPCYYVYDKTVDLRIKYTK